MEIILFLNIEIEKYNDPKNKNVASTHEPAWARCSNGQTRVFPFWKIGPPVNDAV